MLEALEYYQTLAQRFQSQLLTGPGILIVLAGLCIWLAGLRWRRAVGAFVGAAMAAAGIFLVGNYTANIFLIVCVVGLFAGIIINRIVFGIFGALIGVFVITVILAGGSKPAENSHPAWPEYEQSNMIIDAPTAFEITSEMARYLAVSVKNAIFSAGIKNLAAAGLTAVIIIAVALMLPRLLIAAVSSSLGSAIIFAGMIMLLFYKGSRPVSYIAQKTHFYTMTLAAMIIFGTVIQIILSPPAAKNVKTDSSDKENGE